MVAGVSLLLPQSRISFICFIQMEGRRYNRYSNFRLFIRLCNNCKMIHHYRTSCPIDGSNKKASFKNSSYKYVIVITEMFLFPEEDFVRFSGEATHEFCRQS
jgi:hypothetical protein